jgi:uncharacterized protein YdhG (YjbR/CyaY superfamily)
MNKRIIEVDNYLEKLAPERRAALTQLRNLIFETVPGVVEKIWWGMPT